MHKFHFMCPTNVLNRNIHLQFAHVQWNKMQYLYVMNAIAFRSFLRDLFDDGDDDDDLDMNCMHNISFKHIWCCSLKTMREIFTKKSFKMSVSSFQSSVSTPSIPSVVFFACLLNFRAKCIHIWSSKSWPMSFYDGE